MFFLTFQKRIGKIIAPRIAAFVSLLFLIFEKGMKKKKIAPGFLRFVSMLFIILEERRRKKIAP